MISSMKAAIGDEIAKVPGAAHQQSIADRMLEMPVRNFRSSHSRAPRRDCCGSAPCGNERTAHRNDVSDRPVASAIEVAESSRQAVAAMLARCATKRPQGILQPFGQSHETLAAQDDMGMLEARPDKPEVIKQMIERLTGNRDAQVHMSVKSDSPDRFALLAILRRCFSLAVDQLPLFATRILQRLYIEAGHDPRWATPLEGFELDALASVWTGGSIRRLERLVEGLRDARERGRSLQ